jgi:hypothetical protein
MDLLPSILGLIGLACLTVLGIGVSGYLAARRMNETDHTKASTDPTEGDTKS